MTDLNLLIGSIYEAIGEEDAVPSVMSRLSAYLGATLAFWYVVRRGASGDAVRSPFLFNGAFGCHAETLREFREEMWRHDYALQAASVTDRTTETHELISKAELAHNDYAHWIRSSAGVDRRIGRSTDLGDGVVAGWAFHMPCGLPRRARERDDFDILAPHLRNLFRLTSQFGEVRAQRDGLEQIINEQQQAVMLLTADGVLCWASDAARRLTSRNDGIAFVKNKLSFTRCAEKHAFDSLLQSVLDPNRSSPAVAGQLVVTRCNSAFPYVLETAPAPAHFRQGLHSRGAVIVTVHDPDSATDARPEMWREMFNLTRMEASVAALTMRGLSDDTIAGQLGIGVGTVRSHQKQLLAKTETRSKAEAAHLLTRVN